MEIVVKVDRSRIKDPAEHVTKILRRVQGRQAPNAHAEEVFPGLSVGRSAGLVSLELPDDLTADGEETILKALRDDDSIEYAQRPSGRSVKPEVG